jgi:hypothetical protein
MLYIWKNKERERERERDAQRNKVRKMLENLAHEFI